MYKKLILAVFILLNVKTQCELKESLLQLSQSLIELRKNLKEDKTPESPQLKRFKEKIEENIKKKCAFSPKDIEEFQNLWKEVVENIGPEQEQEAFVSYFRFMVHSLQCYMRQEASASGEEKQKILEEFETQFNELKGFVERWKDKLGDAFQETINVDGREIVIKTYLQGLENYINSIKKIPTEPGTKEAQKTPTKTTQAPPPPPVKGPKLTYSRWIKYAQKDEGEARFRLGLQKVGEGEKGDPLFNLVVIGPKLTNASVEDFFENGTFQYPLDKAKKIKWKNNKVGGVVLQEGPIDTFILYDGKKRNQLSLKTQEFEKDFEEKFNEFKEERSKLFAGMVKISKKAEVEEYLAAVKNFIDKILDYYDNNLPIREFPDLVSLDRLENLSLDLEKQLKTIEERLKDLVKKWTRQTTKEDYKKYAKEISPYIKKIESFLSKIESRKTEINKEFNPKIKELYLDELQRYTKEMPKKKETEKFKEMLKKAQQEEEEEDILNAYNKYVNDPKQWKEKVSKKKLEELQDAIDDLIEFEDFENISEEDAKKFQKSIQELLKSK